MEIEDDFVFIDGKKFRMVQSREEFNNEVVKVLDPLDQAIKKSLNKNKEALEILAKR